MDTNMINLKIDIGETEDSKDLTELKKAKETSQGLVDWKIVRKKLMPFSKRPLSEIKRELRNAGHDPRFIDSVISGLKKSSVHSRG